MKGGSWAQDENSPSVDVLAREKDVRCLRFEFEPPSQQMYDRQTCKNWRRRLDSLLLPNSMTTNGSSAEIKLIAELPGACCGLYNTEFGQFTNSQVKQVTKTVRGRSHGTRRNRFLRLARQTKPCDCTTTACLILRRTTTLPPMEANSSSS